jgi:hypothetical protein
MDFNNYTGHQWIINSDRLVLNSKSDNIFILAAKDFAVSTQGDVHINTNNVIVNAKAVQIGLDNTNLEPAAKATSTVNTLNAILNSLLELATSLSSATGQGIGVINLLQVNTAASKLSSQIQQIQKDVDKIKSKIVSIN